jgi:hypothetical protein
LKLLSKSISLKNFLRKICEGKDVCHCSDVALALMTEEATQTEGESLLEQVRTGGNTLAQMSC